MRRVYIIRENEEDGRLLDALKAAGHSTDESDLKNPTCPRCGQSTLLAYTEGEDFDVITWDSIEPYEVDAADSWFLVCSRFDCTYEEEVERVTDPMGAEIFDLQSAHWQFDSYSGMLSRNPLGSLELLEYLRAAVAAAPNRKLECMLIEAEFRYDEAMEWRWKWINKVPLGKRVRFQLYSQYHGPYHEHEEIEGTFVATTDDGFMVLRDPGETMMFVQAIDLHTFSPRRPDKEELSPPLSEVLAEMGEDEAKHSFITVGGGYQMVVIRGHHLRFDLVDRLGQYHVRCWDRVAAEALGLEEKAESYWEGYFRRSEIEERYDVQLMVKVKGHWVDVVGWAADDKSPYVRTEDPAVAAALGLKEQEPWFPPETEEEIRRYRPHWAEVIEEAEVEDRREVRLYHWPLPEFQVPDSR